MPKMIVQGKTLSTVELNWKEVFYTHCGMVSASNVDQELGWCQRRLLMHTEQSCLEEARTQQVPWKKRRPYLSERQWGTGREDDSDNGDAWHYFTHDQARARVYRWGEDGLAGIADDRQRLCFALALWNGNDPILQECLFGLSNGEGSHGENE